MNPPTTPDDTPRRPLRQKIGLGSLSLSLIFHALLLVAGVVWVLRVIPAAEKDVDFTSKSGDSQSSAALDQKHRVQPPTPATRVVAIGLTSELILPDIGQLPQPASLSAGPGSLSAGGGGLGDGRGPGDGGGLLPGMSDGRGDKNPFGTLSMGVPGLIGTFYDLKQTSDRQPTGMTDDEMRQKLREITRRGFRESVFGNYFAAPRKLHQSKLFIPNMAADGAPAAFEVEKEVQPRRWIVVYRGVVTAPSSGRFRFVGACDDLLAVRFNNRPVFDYGYTLAGTGTHLYGRSAEMNGTTENRDLAREVHRLTPMELPITFYRYASTPGLNSHIGGLAVGPDFEVREGAEYPVEIMIGEIPGGFFSVALMIEKLGETYRQDANGAPILPLFRLDRSLPDPALEGEAPPFDPQGPVWKPVTGEVAPGI